MTGPRGYRAVPGAPVRRSSYADAPPRPPRGPGGGSRPPVLSIDEAGRRVIAALGATTPSRLDAGAPYLVPAEWPTYAPTHVHEWATMRNAAGEALYDVCRCGERQEPR